MLYLGRLHLASGFTTPLTAEHALWLVASLVAARNAGHARGGR